ncbi:unnamed protein product, partial [Prorocentrum cordatum]
MTQMTMQIQATSRSRRRANYCERKVDCFTLESSAKARKVKVRGTALLCKTFRAHLVSKTPICLPERACDIHQGQTNRGTILGPAVLDNPDNEWVDNVLNKQKIYGSWRITVGGLCPNGGKEKRPDASVERVFFNSLPSTFFEAHFKRVYVKVVYDMTPECGGVAFACAKLRIGCYGLCMTTEHAEQIRSMTRTSVLAEMKTTGSPIYSTAIATIMKSTGNDPEDTKAKAKKPKKTIDQDGEGGDGSMSSLSDGS